MADRCPWRDPHHGFRGVDARAVSELDRAAPEKFHAEAVRARGPEVPHVRPGEQNSVDILADRNRAPGRRIEVREKRADTRRTRVEAAQIPLRLCGVGLFESEVSVRVELDRRVALSKEGKRETQVLRRRVIVAQRDVGAALTAKHGRARDDAVARYPRRLEAEGHAGQVERARFEKQCPIVLEDSNVPHIRRRNGALRRRKGSGRAPIHAPLAQQALVVQPPGEGIPLAFGARAADEFTGSLGAIALAQSRGRKQYTTQEQCGRHDRPPPHRIALRLDSSRPSRPNAWIALTLSDYECRKVCYRWRKFFFPLRRNKGRGLVITQFRRSGDCQVGAALRGRPQVRAIIGRPGRPHRLAPRRRRFFKASDCCFGHQILQPFTAPPWKNFSGVITPSRLNTRPSFRTKRTARRASRGFPATAKSPQRRTARLRAIGSASQFMQPLASFWRETSPAGATQESPGRKPWEQGQ